MLGMVAWNMWRKWNERLGNTSEVFSSVLFWYCPKCENDCLQKQGATILKSLVTLNHRQSAEIEISKQTTDLLKSIKQNFQSIKQKQTENTQIPSGSAFVEKTKNTSKHIPTTTQTLREPSKKQRDVNTILIVSGNQNIDIVLKLKELFVKSFR